MLALAILNGKKPEISDKEKNKMKDEFADIKKQWLEKKGIKWQTKK